MEARKRAMQKRKKLRTLGKSRSTESEDEENEEEEGEDFFFHFIVTLLLWSEAIHIKVVFHIGVVK